MQEGAGVRQVIEDELRRAGVRLRDLDVRLELGLQESVGARWRRARRGFISRSAIEAGPRRGTVAGGAGRGARPGPGDLARPRERAGDDARRRRRSSTSRASGSPSVIVRWGLGELEPVLRRARRSHRPLLDHERPRSPEPTLPVERRLRGVRPHTPVGQSSRRPAAPRPRTRTASSPLGGGSAIDTAKAVSRCRRGSPVGRRVPTTYSGAEWTTVLRHARRGAARQGRRRRRAHLCGDVYDPRAHARPSAQPRPADGDERARALPPRRSTPRRARRRATEDALAGAALIADALPAVLEDRRDLYARTRLLEGAMRAQALPSRGRAWASPTRSPRRSAAATGCRTGP